MESDTIQDINFYNFFNMDKLPNKKETFFGYLSTFKKSNIKEKMKEQKVIKYFIKEFNDTDSFCIDQDAKNEFEKLMRNEEYDDNLLLNYIEEIVYLNINYYNMVFSTYIPTLIVQYGDKDRYNISLLKTSISLLNNVRYRNMIKYISVDTKKQIREKINELCASTNQKKIPQLFIYSKLFWNFYYIKIRIKWRKEYAYN